MYGSTYEERERLLELGNLLLGERVGLQVAVSMRSHVRGVAGVDVLGQGGVCEWHRMARRGVHAPCWGIAVER